MRVVLFSRVPRWYSFRGDRLLNRLVGEAHEVVGVVVERVRTVVTIREWLNKLGPRVFLEKSLQVGLRRIGLQRTTRLPHLPGFGPRATPVNPPIYAVNSHNSPACIKIVRSLQPDVILLRGCRIIKKPILDIPKLGTLNAHYGLLPFYRGMDVTEWAALCGDPITVSVHFVDQGVDTGAVLASRRVDVQSGDSIGLLREKSAALAVDLFVEVLGKLETGTAVPVIQQPTGGRQYFTMHPRLRRVVNEKLKRA